MQKWEAIRSQNGAIAPCLLQNRRFRRSRNFVENGGQNGNKKKMTNRALGAPGPDFEILGAFWGRLIFYGFLIDKKLVENSENYSNQI